MALINDRSSFWDAYREFAGIIVDYPESEKDIDYTETCFDRKYTEEERKYMMELAPLTTELMGILERFDDEGKTNRLMDLIDSINRKWEEL